MGDVIWKRPFRITDLMFLDPVPGAERQLQDMLDQGDDLPQDYPAYTIGDNYGILCIYGFIPVSEHSVNMWSLFDRRLLKKSAVSWMREARKDIQAIDATRIVAFVTDNPPGGHRIATLLGFTNETPNGMRKFLFGDTYYLYSIVR